MELALRHRSRIRSRRRYLGVRVQSQGQQHWERQRRLSQLRSVWILLEGVSQSTKGQKQRQRHPGRMLQLRGEGSPCKRVPQGQRWRKAQRERRRLQGQRQRSLELGTGCLGGRRRRGRRLEVGAAGRRKAGREHRVSWERHRKNQHR